MLFLSIEHQLHRCTGLFREPGANHPLGIRAELAAEAASHELGDHSYVRLRNLERLREAFTGAVDGLRRNPGGQPVSVPLADASVRFETNVSLNLRRVGSLYNMSRRSEPGIEAPCFLDR